ncbi:MAG: ABC transporter substrate-binding protein [Nocardioides sp.]|nr:ABC transporter substrate-binding protein [Nocardioides sp.]
MATSATPRRTRVRVGALLGAALLLALAACGSTTPPQGFDRFGAISVQYSWIKDEQYAGEYYAEDKGYYAEAGFQQVNAISGPDPTAVSKLVSGKVQVALTDAVSVGTAVAEQDAKLKIIGATFQKNPYAILSLTAGADIKTPAGLKGRRIGVPDADAAVFKALLAANGLDEKRDRITVVPVGTDPAPLLHRDVDAYMGSITDDAPTLQLAGDPVTSLPYADNGVPYVAEAYTVTDDYLHKNKALLEALMTAEIKGWGQTFKYSSATDLKVVEAHFEEAAADKDSVEAGYGTLDPRRTASGLAAEQRLISTPETRSNGLLTISPQLQQETVRSLAAAGWQVPPEDLFDTSVLDAVYRDHPELKKYGSQ